MNRIEGNGRIERIVAREQQETQVEEKRNSEKFLLQSSDEAKNAIDDRQRKILDEAESEEWESFYNMELADGSTHDIEIKNQNLTKKINPKVRGNSEARTITEKNPNGEVEKVHNTNITYLHTEEYAEGSEKQQTVFDVAEHETDKDGNTSKRNVFMNERETKSADEYKYDLNLHDKKVLERPKEDTRLTDENDVNVNAMVNQEQVSVSYDETSSSTFENKNYLLNNNSKLSASVAEEGTNVKANLSEEKSQLVEKKGKYTYNNTDTIGLRYEQDLGTVAAGVDIGNNQSIEFDKK